MSLGFVVGGVSSACRRTVMTEIDTAAVRALYVQYGNLMPLETEILALCDALDEARARNEELCRAVIARDEREIDMLMRTEKAEAAIERVRTLVCDQSVEGWTDDVRMFTANEVLAALDGDQ